MNITPAQLADAEVILALQKLAYQQEAARYDDYSILPLRQTLDEIRAEFGTHTFLKASEGGRIVGSVRAYKRQGTCHIGRLIVHPDHQRQGIGTALLHAIEAAFAGAERFELFTGSISEGNIRLYRRLGYAVFKTEALNERVTLVYLEKRRADA
ncbi:MAG: GNAT family N-acetyltransferase [Anaerolineae bacterium]|nr:GNAT family N-acetyltransferase [Anaerolineae bacterium]